MDGLDALSGYHVGWLTEREIENTLGQFFLLGKALSRISSKKTGMVEKREKREKTEPVQCSVHGKAGVSLEWEKHVLAYG